MKLSQILKEIQVEPSTDLKDRVWDGIKKHSIKKARVNFALSFAGLFVSFIAIFPAFIYLLNGFYQSGFVQYMPEIFSDGGTVLTFWKDYLSLIAESAPIFEFSIVLAIVFILLWSFKIVIKNAKPAFLTI